MLLSKYKREPEAWNEHVVPYYESVSEEWVSEVAQSCPTLCNPMGRSLQGSSVHEIFQARVLEWVAISFSRGSFWPRDRTGVSRIEADTLPSEPLWVRGYVIIVHPFRLNPWLLELDSGKLSPGTANTGPTYSRAPLPWWKVLRDAKKISWSTTKAHSSQINTEF